MKPTSSGARGRAAAAAGAAAAVAIAAAPACASAATTPADTVLRGGTIRTFDAKFSVVRALAVRDGRIVYAGGAQGARRFIGAGTKVRNLHGRTVMPGLGDAHIHVLAGGEQLVTCNLEYAALTVQQFRTRIQKCLDDDKDAGAGDFLQVVNWYRQAMQPAGTDATKATLDALRTDRPIIVSSSDGHTTLVNTRALQIAGITAATADPPSGRIDRDANGQPTGILEDAAGSLVADKVPPPTAKDTRTALAAALKALAAAGVTAVEHQIATPQALAAYRALRRRGKLTLRVDAAPDVSVTQARKNAGAAVKRLLRLRSRYETGPLTARAGIRVRAAGELFQDGVLQAPAHTASLLSPYFDENGRPTTDAGPAPYWPDPTMRKLLVRLVRTGFTPQVHAIGDRAVRATLDDYAAVRRQVGRKPRLAIAHAELVDPADYGRFKSLRVTPVMSFQWGKPGPDSIEAAKVFMGPQRFDRMEPEGRLEQAGARIAYGSDWPVDPLNEFFAVEVGVTRRNDPASGYHGRLNSDPGLSRREAFRAITTNSAYEMGTERRTGSLVRGKLADYIVVDRDPMKVRATAISQTKVLRTVVGGRTVYRR
jgi:predicted amidohydrolase YtcJ